MTKKNLFVFLTGLMKKHRHMETKVDLLEKVYPQLKVGVQLILNSGH